MEDDKVMSYVTKLWSQRAAQTWSEPTVFSRLLPVTTERTWRERLFTRPWRPWVRYVTVVREHKGTISRVRIGKRFDLEDEAVRSYLEAEQRKLDVTFGGAED